MFTDQGIRSLHTWTHERIDLLIDHTRRLSPAEFTRELPGFGQPSVQAQFMHILGAEERWVRRLQDLPIQTWSPADFPTAAALPAVRDRVVRETRAYLDRLPADALNAPLTRPPQEWVGELRSPAFILHHVLTHAFHHKGQVVAMCRLLGHPAPDTDLQQG